MNKLIINFKNNINSVTLFVYLINVILIALLYNNPLISGLILISLIIMAFLTRKEKIISYFKFSGVIFIVTILFNVILNQRGHEILLSIPFVTITTESLLNGVILGLSFINLLWSFYLYDSLARVKVIFELLSNFLKSIAVVFILTIKFIPQIIEVFTETKALGKFRKSSVNDKKNLFKKAKQTIDLTEIVLNKSIAKFMNVSDTLILKGYEQRQQKLDKTEYKKIDLLLLSLLIISMIFNLLVSVSKITKVNFGSARLVIPLNNEIIWVAVINCVLIVLPVLMGGLNYLWWKFYISKTTASVTITAKKYR